MVGKKKRIWEKILTTVNNKMKIGEDEEKKKGEKEEKETMRKKRVKKKRK